MDFQKENFNAFFKQLLDTMLIYTNNQIEENKKILFFKTTVQKFHYFIYLILLKQAIEANTYSSDALQIMDGVFQKIKNGKFPYKLGKEDVEVSLETVANLIIINNDATTKKCATYKSEQPIDFNEFLSFFIAKNFAVTSPDFEKVVSDWGDVIVKNTNMSTHFSDIKSAFATAEEKRIFHNDAPSRKGYSAYTGIGESVQKQSISTNAGWMERFEWIIDAFSTRVSSISKMPENTTSIERVKSKMQTERASYNIVIYGPPGTGKTRAAAVVSTSILNGEAIDITPDTLNLADNPKVDVKFKLRYFSTQFHPSFSYEDFFEGLRPVNSSTDEKNEVNYVVVPGIFKVVCQLARAYFQPKEYGIELSVNFKTTPEGNAIWHFEDSLMYTTYKLGDRPGYFTFKGKVIGQTGNLEPINILPEANPNTNGRHNVKWYYSGVEEQASFVLFIDELNRGNPARVFGEALSLIEDTKRIGKLEESEIILPYSQESFMVPPNLSIICAMNSSDKSLSNLDQAFRRRFSFIYLAPAFDIITNEIFKKRLQNVFSEDLLKSLSNHFQAINDSLKATRVPQENFIGHSYLINLLRRSYADDKKFKVTQQQDRPPIESIVRSHLKNIWESELHGLVREIVGDQRIEEFCDNFSAEVSKSRENTLFLSINEDIAKSLYKYLDNIQPVSSQFPWRKAA